MTCTKVLVLPVYRKAWLFHAWSEAEPAAAVLQALDWRKGKDWQEKFSIASKSLRNRFDSTVKTQWRGLQASKEGSLQRYLYMFAQAVLSREDPTESFLKAVPKETSRVEVMYPPSLKEASVRRRLRLIALRRASSHRRGMVTPLPNITVYYSVYRLLSHLQAMQGANALKLGFERLDALQVQRLQGLFKTVKTGGESTSGGFFSRGHRNRADRETARRDRFLALVDKHAAAGEGYKHPVLHLQPSELLDQVTKPLERWHTPLGDDAADTLSRHFNLDSLKHLSPHPPSTKEHLSRARTAAIKIAGTLKGEAATQK